MRRIILALAIWSMFCLVCLIAGYAHAKDIPPGLAKVMAEGAGRVANMTCVDVRAAVAVMGEVRAEAVARSAGATDRQIKDAKRCLGSSSR